MSHHEENYYRGNNDYDRFPKRKSRESMFGEILGEVPVIGELAESFRFRSGNKGIKKFCCCCAPIAILLLIPLGMLVYWLIRSAMSLFKIDITNINWLEQSKNWLMGNFGLDQIGQWFGGLQGIIGQ